MPNTQKEEVLEYIRKNGSITRLQAAQLYIFELSARIGELEKLGYIFNRREIGGTNKYGRKWKGVRYSINERKTREKIQVMAEKRRRAKLSQGQREFEDAVRVMP